MPARLPSDLVRRATAEVGRMLTDTFAGIAPSSVPAFILFQIVGGLCGVALGRYLNPNPRRRPHRRPRDRDPGALRSTPMGELEIPTVLFLCVHNAGRSQMALGWFNQLAADRAVA